MDEVKIDKAEIKQLIETGDNCDGTHILIVFENGETKTGWLSTTGEYYPECDINFIANIPALDPDGSGKESEDAWDLIELSDIQETKEQIETVLDEEDISVVEWLETHYPEEWKEDREMGKEWLAEEWLKALNAEHNDLFQKPQHFYFYFDGQEDRIIERKFEFVWEESI